MEAGENMSYAFRVAVRHHYGTTVKLLSKEPYQVYKIAPKGWYFTDKYKTGMKTTVMSIYTGTSNYWKLVRS